MIESIDITKLGIFKEGESKCTKFDKINILFGYNYSGKTTLSRAFALFDKKEKQKQDDSKDSFEFIFKLKDGSKIKSEDADNNDKIRTKVFNSDYVENNLFFSDAESSNILLLAENAKDTMEKITKLNEEIKQAENSKNQQEKLKEEKDNELKSIKTDESKNISQRLNIPSFTANSFNSIAKQCSEKDIISDKKEISDKEKIAKAEKNKENISEIELLSNIDVEDFKSILNETVQITTPLERLKNNEDAQKWVREGLELHHHTSKWHDGSDVCLYCGQRISQEIINKLNAHFDKSYDGFISKIDNAKNNINKIRKIDVNPPDISDIYEQFQDNYKNAVLDFRGEQEKYKKALDELYKKLEEKQKAVTRPLEYDIEYDFQKISNNIKEINDIIGKHNTFNKDFENEKKNALEKLKKHYVASVIMRSDYKEIEKAIEEANTEIQNKNDDITSKTGEKKKLENQISSSGLGAEKINEAIARLFMGSSAIKLEPKDPDNQESEKYVVKRNGEIARRLSEGEKTAIAFAHFIASLESKELPNNKKDIILFIDDPISSLDDNHIYSVFLEIEKLKENYKQLFVSTHNYRFFRLLYYKENNKYYVQRCNTGNSTIKDISKDEILCRESEYLFLFNRIKRYTDDGSENIYVIGNLMRKLLEIFVSYKNPQSIDFRTKLKNIGKEAGIPQDQMDNIDKVVYKVVNDESHSSLEKEHLDGEGLKKVAKDVLEFIKSVDPVHYKFLEERYKEEKTSTEK